MLLLMRKVGEITRIRGVHTITVEEVRHQAARLGSNVPGSVPSGWLREKDFFPIGEEITITIVEIKPRSVKLGIDAPPHIAVHREEVWRRIQEGAQPIRTKDVKPRGSTSVELSSNKQPCCK